MHSPNSKKKTISF